MACKVLDIVIYSDIVDFELIKCLIRNILITFYRLNIKILCLLKLDIVLLIYFLNHPPIPYEHNILAG